ncbi:PolC-type DNA polymerase III [Bacillus salitolerans]|uniref:PolC-type DNA polymerase III n=1 Tax=Bacillus salitolerans TaxID=1437434 RepID=A0ABW4LQZ7_9BACI
MPIDIRILTYLFWGQFIQRYRIKKIKKQLDVDQIIYTLNECFIRNTTSLEDDFNKQTYTVFDLETTGFFPGLGDEILSLGAVKVENRKILHDQTFYKVLSPLSKVSHFSKQLTGLTEHDFNNGSTFPEVITEFFRWNQNATLVAHPANFDVPFLEKSMKKWGLPTNGIPCFVDSLTLANSHFPNQQNTLDELIKRFKVTTRKRHHALNDAITTAEIYVQLLNQEQIHGGKSYG